MSWTWDRRKEAENRRKHGVTFEDALLVFDDPLHVSRPDPYPNEERCQTLGLVAGLCLFVVHTYIVDEATGEEGGRIISARRATRQERKAYEEGKF